MSARMPPTTTRPSMTSRVVPSGPRRRRPLGRGGPLSSPSPPSGRAGPSPGPVGPSNHSERLTALLVPPSGCPVSTVGEQCTPAACVAIGHHGPVTDSPQPVTDPLTLAALDTERHVARSGWDQPVRLFALVPTSELLAHEPHLADGMAPHDAVTGALSAVEQDELPDSEGLEDLLARIAWPEQVAGCAIAVE